MYPANGTPTLPHFIIMTSKPKLKCILTLRTLECIINNQKILCSWDYLVVKSHYAPMCFRSASL